MPWYLALAIYLGCAACLVFGIAIGRRSSRAVRRDADLLAFLEQTGYSLQCLCGFNGDDNTWQVTDGIVAKGAASYDMREAIESAAQGVTANG